MKAYRGVLWLSLVVLIIGLYFILNAPREIFWIPPSLTGLQAFEPSVLTINGSFPSNVSQAAAVQLDITGADFNSSAVLSISNPNVTVLSLVVVNATLIQANISVSINASDGLYDMTINQTTDSSTLVGGLNITEGPFDVSTLANVTPVDGYLVFNTSSNTSDAVNLTYNITTAFGVNKSQVNVTGGWINLTNLNTSNSAVLNLTAATDPQGTFTLQFAENTFTEEGTYLGEMYLDLLVDGTYVEREYYVYLGVGAEPPLCTAGHIVGATCCTVGASFPVCPVGRTCGQDWDCNTNDPGAGTTQVFPTCPVGVACTIVTVAGPVQVCSTNYAGIPGLPCASAAPNTCTTVGGPAPPFSCLPATFPGAMFSILGTGIMTRPIDGGAGGPIASGGSGDFSRLNQELHITEVEIISGTQKFLITENMEFGYGDDVVIRGAAPIHVKIRGYLIFEGERIKRVNAVAFNIGRHKSVTITDKDGNFEIVYDNIEKTWLPSEWGLSLSEWSRPNLEHFPPERGTTYHKQYFLPNPTFNIDVPGGAPGLGYTELPFGNTFVTFNDKLIPPVSISVTATPEPQRPVTVTFQGPFSTTRIGCSVDCEKVTASGPGASTQPQMRVFYIPPECGKSFIMDCDSEPSVADIPAGSMAAMKNKCCPPKVTFTVTTGACEKGLRCIPDNGPPFEGVEITGNPPTCPRDYIYCNPARNKGDVDIEGLGFSQDEFNEVFNVCCHTGLIKCKDCPEVWECEQIGPGFGPVQFDYGFFRHWPKKKLCWIPNPEMDIEPPCPNHRDPCNVAAATNPALVGSDDWDNCCASCGNGIVEPPEECEPDAKNPDFGTTAKGETVGCTPECKQWNCLSVKCETDADCKGISGGKNYHCEDGKCMSDCELDVFSIGQAPFFQLVCVPGKATDPRYDKHCPDSCWPDTCECVEFLTNFMGACTETNIFTDLMHLITIDSMGGGFQQQDFTFTKTQFPGAMGIMQELCCEPQAECEKNGVVDRNEQCDPSVHGMEGVCSDECEWLIPAPYCGNGVIEKGEQCDPPDGVLCNNDCSAVLCDPKDPACVTCIPESLRQGKPTSLSQICATTGSASCNSGTPAKGRTGCCTGPVCRTDGIGGGGGVGGGVGGGEGAAGGGDFSDPTIICGSDCAGVNYLESPLTDEQIAKVRKQTDKLIIGATRISNCCSGSTSFTKYVPNQYANTEAFLLRDQALKIDSLHGAGVVCKGRAIDDYFYELPVQIPVEEIPLKFKPVTGEASMDSHVKAETAHLPIEVWFDKPTKVTIEMPSVPVEVAAETKVLSAADITLPGLSKETYNRGKMYIKWPAPVEGVVPVLAVQVGKAWIDLNAKPEAQALYAEVDGNLVKEYFASGMKARFAALQPDINPAELDRLVLQHDGGSSQALIFIQGATTNTVNIRKFVAENKLTHNEKKIYAFIYSPTQPYDRIVKKLAEEVSSTLLKDGVTEVYIAAYSLGGLIMQDAAAYAKANNLALANMVDVVVYVGAPFGGTKVVDIWNRYLQYVLNSNTAASLIGVDSSIYNILLKGKQEPSPALDVDYGLVIGTRPLLLTDALFEADDRPRDGVVVKDDAIPVWWPRTTECDPDIFYIFASHDQLPGAWPVRDFIYKKVNAQQHLDNPMMPVLGYGQSVQASYDGCAEGDIVVFVGDALADKEVPHACSCGDGVCGLGENFLNCPADCSTFWQKLNICLWIPWVVNLLLAVLLVSAVIYVSRKEKTHQRGKGFKVISYLLLVAFGLLAVHYVSCQYLVPLAILLLLVIAVLLGSMWYHFRKPKP